MMNDLQNGLWSELAKGIKIDTYRRNLQRAYIDRLSFLMTDSQTLQLVGHERMGIKPECWSVSLIFDLLLEDKLNKLKNDIEKGMKRVSDTNTKYHLQDAISRINIILDDD